jgi:oxygen-independent coproporphyrinogen-3 oxidase
MAECELQVEKAARPPWLWPRAAYVHVPFCAHHCGYCDFAVVTGQDQRIDLYLEALECELNSRLGQAAPVATIFLGGGTPTYLNPRQLGTLLTSLRRWLPLETNYEFTVEANPGGLNSDKVQVLREHGVNRISLGAQSFHKDVLRTLERDHAPSDVARAVDTVRKYINNVCLDLIFGVPGQTLADWQADLDRALELAPFHLSTYGLTFEKGTRLWKARTRGEVEQLDEETELAMYVHAMDRLEGAGFEHYEISNFARPGRRCQHNQVYWANESYFGFGLGAARYVQCRRDLNTRDIQTYLRRALSGEDCAFQSEVLSPPERARETMALQLRRAEGVNRRRFQRQTGCELDDLAAQTIATDVGLGLLCDDGASVYLTRQGKCVADSVIEGLFK